MSKLKPTVERYLWTEEDTVELFNDILKSKK